MADVNEMHKVALGEGEAFASEASNTLAQSEVKAFEVVGRPLLLLLMELVSRDDLSVSVPSIHQRSSDSACSFEAPYPTRLGRESWSGLLASKPRLGVFCDTVPPRSIPRSSCCQRSSTAHRVLAHRLVEQATGSLRAPVEAKIHAKHHGLFLSHLISVGRDTPKMRVMPRIEGRSL
jgi:hypothetical protein